MLTLFISICLGLAFLLIWFLYYGTKMNKQNEQTLINLGYDVTKRIKFIKYLTGHPDIDNSLGAVCIIPKDGAFEIMQEAELNISLDTAIKGKIEFEKISNVIVEDQTSIEKKVSLGKVLAVGVLALALKNEEKKELAFLTVQWNDGKFEHNTIFEINGNGALQVANASRNILIKEVRANEKK